MGEFPIVFSSVNIVSKANLFVLLISARPCLRLAATLASKLGLNPLFVTGRIPSQCNKEQIRRDKGEINLCTSPKSISQAEGNLSLFG